MAAIYPALSWNVSALVEFAAKLCPPTDLIGPSEEKSIV